MATKFEDAVAALKAENFDSPHMLQVLDIITEQNDRIKNLEAASLGTKQAISTLDAASQSHGVSIGSLAQDRQAHAAQLAAVVAQPAADSAKVADLEKRVTAVEGAVGSKMWKRAEAPRPVLPLAAEPVTPKPGIFSGFTGAPAENPSAAPAGTP
jgi:hypothetical protein